MYFTFSASIKLWQHFPQYMWFCEARPPTRAAYSSYLRRTHDE